MKLNLQKTATACGLFASGVIAGYTVSCMSHPLKKHLPVVRGYATSLADFKIMPIIPEFDTDTPLDDLGLDLAMNE
jgi:hypothetical protein